MKYYLRRSILTVRFQALTYEGSVLPSSNKNIPFFIRDTNNYLAGQCFFGITYNLQKYLSSFLFSTAHKHFGKVCFNSYGGSRQFRLHSPQKRQKCNCQRVQVQRIVTDELVLFKKNCCIKK
jgi:hypothetical protein